MERSANRRFAVIREAIRKEGKVAIGKVVFTSREHIIALEARGKGLLGITLRYPYEVRKEEEYFDEIPDEKRRRCSILPRISWKPNQRILSPSKFLMIAMRTR